MAGQMRCWELPDQFVFQPHSGLLQILSIDRATGNASLIQELPAAASGGQIHSSTVYGVLGAVKLLTGTYVLVVTERECAGSYSNSPLFKVKSMRFLQCEHTRHLSPSKIIEEAYLRGLLKHIEQTPGLYFSYETDLTNNAQRTHLLTNDHENQPLWKQADPQFVWNDHLKDYLLESKAEGFILPVIQGSFQSVQVLLAEQLLQITLISRRSIRRSGTRMWRRGADPEGSVANFVETEQILEAGGYFASYVQVRGSIPVFWEQIVDLRYKPQIRSINHEDTSAVVERHFSDLSDRYGSVLAVDLINQQGSEGVLSIAYRNAMQHLKNNNVTYVPFDFHHICGNIRFDRLSVLHDQIAENLMQQRFFLVNPMKEKTEEQKGIVRTNCIDCLDRTNVTQSLLGRKALEEQLRRLGLFQASETIDKHYVFDSQFNILWANHGDEISYQYAGTPALKGDFVRYGKRTIAGLIQDGISAISRYYLNNFHDGRRQDAMDLVTGRYKASDSSSPHRSVIAGIATYMPLIAAVIVASICATAMSLWNVSRGDGRVMFTMLWASVTAVLGMVVRTNGQQLCCTPRLRGLK
ncbi:phosphoinositide phosphatase SAC6 [Selaginella moellendorffii]|uniref:phosphoinositide phosphatase SAC6 n=1 Tax=Selaginella moellendorffii TaxID=88036 RepID=UPI000D1C7B12|nr:phosphoinositide phosphatase SAC6 [Selaginella moellendorffii]|eukprot:XP_024534108.1 phosphoinositide phosphatase SAC6 [Selaginella moellendorffii]